MRIWDIVDQFDGVQLTEKTVKPTPISGSLSSTARMGIGVGLLIAASLPTFTIPLRAAASTTEVRIPIPVRRDKKVEVPRTIRRPVGERATDTQYGQSTAKLARVFSTLFQPCTQEEEEFAEGYSF